MKRTTKIPRSGPRVAAVVVTELVPALNKRHTTPRQPNLSDLDSLVYGIIAVRPQWVLIDRNVNDSKGQSSARYIALRRRGFEVAARHVGPIKNYWARWTHDAPPLPSVPGFEGDDGFSYGGIA